ncbi:MAG TPA: Lrp/AsnC ligand binding domain-containing protein [Nitrosopumilaceae archaeon]|nr:Lrp/AsnC ligand binding domain-containing protein [Nitrosopumilaceae archaeon]
MSPAFLLINCDLGEEEKVVAELETIDDVKEIQKTFGVFDIVAKVESDSEEDLSDMVSSKIRNLNPVQTVLVLKSV